MKSSEQKKTELGSGTYRVPIYTQAVPIIIALHEKINEKKISYPQAIEHLDHTLKTEKEINKYEKCALLEICLHMELEEKDLQKNARQRIAQIKSIFGGYYINKEHLSLTAKIKLAFIRLTVDDLMNYINLTGLSNFINFIPAYLNHPELAHSQEAQMWKIFFACIQPTATREIKRAAMAKMKELVDKKFIPAYYKYVVISKYFKKMPKEVLLRAAEENDIEAQYIMGYLSENIKQQLFWFEKAAQEGSESALYELIYTFSLFGKSEDRLRVIKLLEKEAFTGRKNKIKELFWLTLLLTMKIKLTSSTIKLRSNYYFLEKLMEDAAVIDYLFNQYKNNWGEIVSKLKSQIEIRSFYMEENIPSVVETDISYDSLLRTVTLLPIETIEEEITRDISPLPLTLPASMLKTETLSKVLEQKEKAADTPNTQHNHADIPARNGKPTLSSQAPSNQVTPARDVKITLSSQASSKDETAQADTMAPIKANFSAQSEKASPSLPLQPISQKDRLIQIYYSTYSKECIVSAKSETGQIWEIFGKGCMLGRGELFFEKLEGYHLFSSLFPSNLSEDLQRKNIIWVKNRLHVWDIHFKQQPREEKTLSFIPIYSLILSQESNNISEDIHIRPTKKTISRGFTADENFAAIFGMFYRIPRLDEKSFRRLKTKLSHNLRWKYHFFSKEKWVPLEFETQPINNPPQGVRK